MNQPASPPRPGKRLLRIALLCAGCYLAACVTLAVFQRRFIYYPTRIPTGTLEQMAKRESVQRWQDAAGRNIGWKALSPARPADGQVLVTHGNAGCAIDRGYFITPIQQCAAMDVFILEYPGYGDRAGSPGEESLFAAADEAFQLLASNGPVYLAAESLGTGVAAYLAGKYPDKTAGIVLLAPFNRMADVGQAQMPVFPVAWLLRDRFPSENYLRNYHGPVAVVVGGRDRVIPAKFGRLLFDRYTGPKRLWEYPDGDHETVMVQPPEVWKQIFEFWEANALNR